MSIIWVQAPRLFESGVEPDVISIWKTLTMIKKIILCAFLLCTSAVASNDLSLNEKLSELDKKSKEVLGVSIQAVRFLLDHTPCSLSHSDILKENASLQYIIELEEAGLITTKVISHTPDGYDESIDLIEVSLKEENSYDECQ